MCVRMHVCEMDNESGRSTSPHASVGGAGVQSSTPMAVPHGAPLVEVKLFVGRVPQCLDEQAITAIFKEFGPVTDCVIIRDKVTNKHKNSVFVKIASIVFANAAIRALHGIRSLDSVLGPITVKYAAGECERLGLPSTAGDGGVDQAKLFLGSIPRSMTEDELKTFFASFGVVDEVFIMRDSTSRQSRGCAFVKLQYKEEGKHAIQCLSGKHVFEGCNRPVEVRFAETKSIRPQQIPMIGFGSWGSVMPRGPALRPVLPPLPVSNSNPRQVGHWKEYFAPDGRPYYHNDLTGTTTWERPADFERTPALPASHSHTVGTDLQNGGPPGANVFVFHIPQEWTKHDVLYTFGSFGNIVSCHLAMDKYSQRNRGFAFVSYDNIHSAVQAVNSLNNCLANNKRLNVSIKRGEEHHAAHLFTHSAKPNGSPHQPLGQMPSGSPFAGAQWSNNQHPQGYSAGACLNQY